MTTNSWTRRAGCSTGSPTSPALVNRQNKDGSWVNDVPTLAAHLTSFLVEAASAPGDHVRTPRSRPRPPVAPARR